jgi:glutaredoxin
MQHDHREQQPSHAATLTQEPHQPVALRLLIADTVMSPIEVYGTPWCGFTFILREYLMRARVDHNFFDIDRDAWADEFVRTMNDGKRKFPMVVVAERVVINPTVTELQRLLDDQGVVARRPPGM